MRFFLVLLAACSVQGKIETDSDGVIVPATCEDGEHVFGMKPGSKAFIKMIGDTTYNLLVLPEGVALYYSPTHKETIVMREHCTTFAMIPSFVAIDCPELRAAIQYGGCE